MNQQKVRDFHKAFELPLEDEPITPDPSGDLSWLRRALLSEEFYEYIVAEQQGDLVEIAKELADVLYIAYGTAAAYGFDLDEVFEEVHRSNMAKLDKFGRPKYRNDGKVLKPDGWTPPDIRKVLSS